MEINERLLVFLSEWNFVHTQINHKHSVHTHTRCAGVCVCFQFQSSLQSVRVCFFYSFVSVHRKTTTAATHSSSKFSLNYHLIPNSEIAATFYFVIYFSIAFFFFGCQFIASKASCILTSRTNTHTRDTKSQTQETHEEREKKNDIWIHFKRMVAKNSNWSANK